MPRAPMLPAALLLILAVAVASCGGSSSETPWPVEPEGAQLGPAGERAVPRAITDDRQDGGVPTKP